MLLYQCHEESPTYDIAVKIELLVEMEDKLVALVLLPAPIVYNMNNE